MKRKLRKHIYKGQKSLDTDQIYPKRTFQTGIGNQQYIFTPEGWEMGYGLPVEADELVNANTGEPLNIMLPQVTVVAEKPEGSHVPSNNEYDYVENGPKLASVAIPISLPSSVGAAETIGGQLFRYIGEGIGAAGTIGRTASRVLPGVGRASGTAGVLATPLVEGYNILADLPITESDYDAYRLMTRKRGKNRARQSEDNWFIKLKNIMSNWRKEGSGNTGPGNTGPGRPWYKSPWIYGGAAVLGSGTGRHILKSAFDFWNSDLFEESNTQPDTVYIFTDDPEISSNTDNNNTITDLTNTTNSTDTIRNIENLRKFLGQ